MRFNAVSVRRVPTVLLIAAAVVVAACSPSGGVPEYVHGEAVPADSPAISSWATAVEDYSPGDEAESYTDSSEALGEAEGSVYSVVCLGRGGSITLSFGEAIENGEGADFAVFENGFYTGDGLFAELAYVEVSSDGETFARFPVTCENESAVSSNATIDTDLYTGFAGLYEVGTGTAFDLAECMDRDEVVSGAVDLGAITAIRVVDVVGDGSEYDATGAPIYDPYPTTGTAGFDLDAVAVLGSGD